MMKVPRSCSLSSLRMCYVFFLSVYAGTDLLVWACSKKKGDVLRFPFGHRLDLSTFEFYVLQS